jgi:hypothetical protein
VACTVVPTGPPGEPLARMAGERRRMVMVNVSQMGAVVALLPQTVVGPKEPARVGVPVRNPVGRRVTPGGSGAPVAEKTRSGVLEVNWWR